MLNGITSNHVLRLEKLLEKPREERSKTFYDATKTFIILENKFVWLLLCLSGILRSFFTSWTMF